MVRDLTVVGGSLPLTKVDQTGPPGMGRGSEWVRPRKGSRATKTPRSPPREWCSRPKGGPLDTISPIRVILAETGVAQGLIRWMAQGRGDPRTPKTGECRRKSGRAARAGGFQQNHNLPQGGGAKPPIDWCPYQRNPVVIRVPDPMKPRFAEALVSGKPPQGSVSPRWGTGSTGQA